MTHKVKEDSSAAHRVFDETAQMLAFGQLLAFGPHLRMDFGRGRFTNRRQAPLRNPKQADQKARARSRRCPISWKRCRRINAVPQAASKRDDDKKHIKARPLGRMPPTSGSGGMAPGLRHHRWSWCCSWLQSQSLEANRGYEGSLLPCADAGDMPCVRMLPCARTDNSTSTHRPPR